MLTVIARVMPFISPFKEQQPVIARESRRGCPHCLQTVCIWWGEWAVPQAMQVKVMVEV